MRKIVGCLFVWGCLVSAALGREIYVDNTSGDDRQNGNPTRTLVANGPVRTLAKALRLAETGDTIVLADTEQPYRESVSLTGSKHSGRPDQPLVIQGNGATLDGSVPIPAGAWTHHVGDVFCHRPALLGYQQLFLSGRPALRRPAADADVSLPALEARQWCWWNGQIYFCVEAGRLPEDYQPSCCGLASGITLYYVEHVVIQDLTIQGYQADGINANDVMRTIKINRLTCRGNGRSGIAIGGASRVEINACLLGDNGAAQLMNTDFAQTHVYDSELIDNTAAAVLLSGGHVFIDGKPLPFVSRKSQQRNKM